MILQQLYEDEQDVLNLAITWPTTSTRDLCVVSEELLTIVLDLYVKYQGKWSYISSTSEFQGEREGVM